MTPIKKSKGFFENSILLLRDSFFKRKGWDERGRKKREKGRSHLKFKFSLSLEIQAKKKKEKKSKQNNGSVLHIGAPLDIYSTANSTQYSVIAYMGKESKKEWIEHPLWSSGEESAC